MRHVEGLIAEPCQKEGGEEIRPDQSPAFWNITKFYIDNIKTLGFYFFVCFFVQEGGLKVGTEIVKIRICASLVDVLLTTRYLFL